MPGRYLRFCLILGLSCLTSAGCTEAEWNSLWDKKEGSQPEPSPDRTPIEKSLVGTVYPLVTVEGLMFNQVRGYGVVVDLVDMGGSDGPKVVKDHIIGEIRRLEGVIPAQIDPAEFLASRDTALVEVMGLIPAAAEKGTRFDVMVKALGTQTRSLVGGRLVLCNLTRYAVRPQGVIEGKKLAEATGPIFISPYEWDAETGKKHSSEVGRLGFVLGGGVVTEPRSVGLVLSTPSHGDAVRVRDRLNEQFMKETTVAEAKGPGRIDLKIPEDYGFRKSLFIDRVLHTHLNRNPDFLNRRAEELAVEITHQEADYESIGLSWEATGPIVLPIVQRIYRHPSAATRFYAARTGLRLGDVDAVEVIGKFAVDPGSPLRPLAIEELGYAISVYQAGECLRKLTDDSDTSVRVSAYNGLLRHHHPAVKTHVLDQDNILLDVIETKGPPLIYVWSAEAQRIAVFGGELACRPPMIFPLAQKQDWPSTVQVNANAGDDHLTVICRNKRTGVTSPPLKAPLNVAGLIRFLGGRFRQMPDAPPSALGVPFGEVVDMLGVLCERKAIPATFTLQEETIEKALNQRQPRERQESEVEN